ncbi:hypothetical protein SLS56_007964 [Neofusicoccum ribis]|uniref:Apiosidase-like catalytic domain-containing protein n=1 Tax=Neofusicoccum ribis TaxID=45134 RepID=A0ABR3SMD0_9PEZI
MRWSSLFVTVAQLLVFCNTAAATWTVPDEYAITPSADGHFFQQSDGRPFFWQADTAWLLFHRLNYSECESYFADRAAKGFNVVLAVGFTQIGIDSPNRNGDLTFIDEDVTRPNEAYWAYIDSIVELAWSRGIRIALVPAWGNSKPKWKIQHKNTIADDSKANVGSAINTTTAEPFGHFIGQRYPYLPKILVADTNPWWTNKTAIKADYAAGGAAPARPHTDWSAVYDGLAHGIVVGERAAVSSATWWPLMTIHPTNQWFAGGPVALASAFFAGRDWLTFDACQSGHADFPPNPPIPWWNARRGWEPVERMYAAGEVAGGRTQPVLDNEAHYEGRHVLWAFSGAAGVTYGADNVMQMYIPGLFDHSGSGPARSWADDIHLPGSDQIQYIKKVIMDRGMPSYFHRIPAQDILVGNTGADDRRAMSRPLTDGYFLYVDGLAGDRANQSEPPHAALTRNFQH